MNIPRSKDLTSGLLQASLKRQQDQHAALLDEVQAIAERAKAENRELTGDETTRCNELLAQAETVKANMPRTFPMPQADTSPSGFSFRTPDGRTVRALSPKQQLSAVLEGRSGSQDDAPPAGEIIRGLLCGEVSSDIRAALESTDDRGGYLLSPMVSTRIIDLARAASVVMRAGGQTLPISGETRIVRVNEDPTSYWRPEGVSVTSSDVLFDAVTLRPKTLATIVPISIELLEDSGNAAQVIESVISSAMALKLDQAALVGTGASSEPLGVRNHTGVNTQTSVGTPSDYSNLTTSVKNILTDNYNGAVENLAWIAHPRDFATYDGLADTTGQPLDPTRWAAQLQRLSTTSMPTTEGGGSNESVMVVGDFSQLLVGMRTSITIRVLESGTVTDASSVTHNAASELKKLIVAYMRADVAVLRPTWFDVLSGVTA